MKTTEVIDKLVTEISQSFFLTNTQKKEHINSLLKIRDNITIKSKDKKQENDLKIMSNDKSFMSILLAMITFAYILVTMSLSEIFNRLNTPYSYDKLISLMIISITIPIIMFSLLQFIKLKRESIDYNKRARLLRNKYKHYYNSLDN